MFTQQLINGITVGGIYALIALGYTMVYGILKIVNFAHGDVFMIGSFLGLVFVQGLGMPIYVAFPLAAVATAILGGIGSIPGAMLGGFLIGIVETLGAGYISAGYKDAFAFGILILVLIFRPSGLLGKKHVDKV